MAKTEVTRQLRAGGRPGGTPPRVPSPGQQVGRFELVRELGRGGMGVVYLARDTRLGRKVAIKFLAGVEDRMVARFVTEARTTATCTHDNIVLVYEVGEHAGLPFMVLEHVDGQSLAEYVGARRVPPREACELMVPVVRALVRAHEAGIVHRDLKPTNILISRRGVVKVLDFGIAKLFDLEGASASATALPRAGSEFDVPITQTDETDEGALVGTWPYMSPEQWGADAIDGRSDLWAVGILFWRLVVGAHPAGRLDPAQVMRVMRDLARPLPGIETAAPQVSSGFAAMVNRCLAKRRVDRYPTAAALLRDLEALLRGRDDGGDAQPYLGLDAFRETDADRFYGRNAEVRAAVNRLRDQPLLAVVGASGSGKSSFVFAGLVPALHAEGGWHTAALRPGRRPLAALAAAVAAFGAHVDVAALAEEPGQLGQALRRAAEHQRGRLLVVVDQFEELFTHGIAPAERTAFIAALLAAADEPTSPVRVALTVRADYLEQVATVEALLLEVTRGLLFLVPLDQAATREALISPARNLGYELEDGLADEIVGDLQGTRAPLPLMQFAAARLWERRAQASRRLTREAYRQIGGVVGAFAVHGDRALAGLPPSSQAIARAILVRLVSPERTRVVFPRDELAGIGPATDVARVLEHLVAARLIHVHGEGEDGATVELVHEALIEAWPTLHRWLDEGAAVQAFVHEVRSAARQWHARGRPGGLVWSGEVARDAQARAAWCAADLSDLEREFLDEVARSLRRVARRRRRLVIATVAALSVVIVLGAVALLRIGKAERLAVRRADEAQAAEREAQRQLDAVRAERAQRSAAERDATAARASAQAVKEMSQAELADSNRRLTEALAEAQAARARADANARELAGLLKEAQERARQLEAQRRKVIQKLD